MAKEVTLVELKDKLGLLNEEERAFCWFDKGIPGRALMKERKTTR